MSQVNRVIYFKLQLARLDEIATAACCIMGVVPIDSKDRILIEQFAVCQHLNPEQRTFFLILVSLERSNTEFHI